MYIKWKIRLNIVQTGHLLVKSLGHDVESRLLPLRYVFMDTLIYLNSPCYLCILNHDLCIITY